jgi:hypothetical protein
MTNTNCLEGIACPKCGADDRFYIEATVELLVCDDGTEDEGGDHTWSDDAPCRCGECDHHGRVRDFTVENQTGKGGAPSNLDRAAWADEAIRTFRERTGCDHEDALADLLADLMHWADARDFTFERELARAIEHHDAELAEEGGAA